MLNERMFMYLSFCENRRDAPERYSDHHVALHLPEARCKPWPRHLHCRRRMHKAFLKWHAENQARFVVRLELLKRTDDCLDIGFRGISRVLSATVTDDEIIVAVNWDGICWDLLQDFETYPKRVPGGYVCRECPANIRPVFPSRSGLWRAEVFEPFLQWVNQDLARAEAVSISGTRGRMTWASLVRRPGDDQRLLNITKRA